MGLGVDGSASNDGSNLLEELRVSYLLHRLQSSDKAPSGYDLFEGRDHGRRAAAGSGAGDWLPGTGQMRGPIFGGRPAAGARGRLL